MRGLWNDLLLLQVLWYLIVSQFFHRDCVWDAIRICYYQTVEYGSFIHLGYVVRLWIISFIYSNSCTYRSFAIRSYYFGTGVEGSFSWVPPATPKPSIPAIPNTVIRPAIGRSTVEEEQAKEASWEKCFGG